MSIDLNGFDGSLIALVKWDRKMREKDAASEGALIPTESDILTAWALRFDGWKYCQETSWPEDERLRTTDAVIEQLRVPGDVLRQMTLLFMLQR